MASVNAADSIKMNHTARHQPPIFQLSSQQRRKFNNLAVAKNYDISVPNFHFC